MFRRLRVSTKLVGAIVLVFLLSAGVVGWFVFQGVERVLRTQAIAQLEAVRASRARLAAAHFKRIRDDVAIGARLVATRQMLGDRRRQEIFHPIARGIAEASGYVNVLLASVDGHVMYSFNPDIRVGTDLRSAAWRSTGLGEAFSNAAASRGPDEVRFVDYRPFGPTGTVVGFFGAPVFDQAGTKRIGAIIYRISLDGINAIMADVAGLGASGETYLVGRDTLLRTSTRFATESVTASRRVATDAVKRGLAGETGTIEQLDYRGVRVAASFAPVTVGSATWAVVAEMDLDELLAPVRQFRDRLVLVLLLVTLVAAAVLTEAVRRIVLMPVRSLVQGARRVAHRQYDQPVRLETSDELGELGQAFDGMLSSVAAQVGELQRSQQLLEAAPDAMVIVDRNATISVVNHATERLFGYTRAELIGQKVELLVPEAARAGHPGLRDGYLRNPVVRGMGTGRELSGRRKDGSTVPIEISLSPLDSPEGLLVVAAVRDITERREAERAIRAERERLQKLLDTSPIGVAISVDGIVRFTNPRVAELTNLKVGDPATQAYVDLGDRQRLLDMLKSDGIARDYPARAHGPRGDVRDLLVTYLLTEHQGRPGVLGWLVDITSLKEIERQLQSTNDELVKLQELRDNLTHMLVHDLRSPLTGIKGSLYFLKKEEGKLGEDSRGFIDDAMTATSTLVELISSLLDVNRLESGEMPLTLAPADLGVLAEEAKASLAGLMVGRNVTLEQPNGPVPATVDIELIRRVIGNLIGNALKFTPSKGRIDIVVTSAAGKPRVEVRDTGPGIPPEFQDKVFEKFGQVDPKQKKYSTGIGLTFCKLAVERHGGTIGLRSKVGEGSTFFFELPG